MNDIDKAKAGKAGKISRTMIQNTIFPGICAALAFLELPPGPDAARRVFRALLHIGMGWLLALGCPPKIILGFCLEVLNKELAMAQAAKEPAPTKSGTGAEILNLFGGSTPKGDA